MTLRKKLFWISIFYFTQGMPFGVVLDVLPVYFRQNGVSLTAIGMMGALTLPWTIKVLWSPILDRFGERRTWVTLCGFVMAIAMFCVPLFDASHPGLVLWMLLIAFTVSSATQDIAIDAFSVGIASKGEEGSINSIRAGVYRLGVLASGGATMYLVAPFGWTWVFLGLSLAFVAMAVAALMAPTVKVVHQPAREWAQSFVAFLRRPGSIAVFAFVLVYRMDYVAMGPMIKPFWLDRGMTPAEIGTISTNLGMALGILGALLGGLFTSRFGIFNGLWILGIAQALPNLGYAVVAQLNLGRPYLYAASMAESFGAGLVTARRPHSTPCSPRSTPCRALSWRRSAAGSPISGATRASSFSPSCWRFRPTHCCRGCTGGSGRTGGAVAPTCRPAKVPVPTQKPALPATRAATPRPPRRDVARRRRLCGSPVGPPARLLPGRMLV